MTACPAFWEASAIPAFAVSDKASLPTSCTKASVPAEPSSSNALPNACSVISSEAALAAALALWLL